MCRDICLCRTSGLTMTGDIFLRSGSEWKRGDAEVSAGDEVLICFNEELGQIKPDALKWILLRFHSVVIGLSFTFRGNYLSTVSTSTEYKWLHLKI